MFEDTQSTILWLTSALGLFLALYAAAPKAWQTLGILNALIERGHVWFKHNIMISDVYGALEAHHEQITDHETRITRLERRGEEPSE